MARLQEYFDQYTAAGADDSPNDPTTLFSQPGPVAAQPYVPPTYTAPTRAGTQPVSSGGPYASAPYQPPSYQTPMLGEGTPAVRQPTSGGGNAQTLWQTWWGQGNRARQSQADSLNPFIDFLRASGVNATLDQRTDGMHKGIYLNGDPNQFVKLLDGYDNPIWMPGGDKSSSRTEFTDPWGSQMEGLTSDYIRKLLSSPNRDALNQYVQELVAGKSQAKQRAGQFADSLGGRVEQLRGPAFDEQQIAALRTGATDAFERRRQETLKNEREKVYLRGFEPTSGLVQGAEQEVNRNFEQGRTQIEGDLLRSQIDQTTQNQRYADQLEALIQDALTGGDVTALGYSAQVADIENKRQQDDLARQREAIGATQNPLALIANRLGLANSTLSLSSPAQSSQSYLQLLNALTGQNAMNSQNSNAQWQGIAQLLDVLLG